MTVQFCVFTFGNIVRILSSIFHRFHIELIVCFRILLIDPTFYHVSTKAIWCLTLFLTQCTGSLENMNSLINRNPVHL